VKTLTKYDHAPLERPRGLRPLYYLAHPYSGNIEQNVEESVRLTNILMDFGLDILNPLTHSHYLDWIKSRPPRRWYELDFNILSRCDALVLSPGWESSTGCQMERAFAMGERKRVTTVSQLICAKCTEDCLSDVKPPGCMLANNNIEEES
jgi:hypothetical protein